MKRTVTPIRVRVSKPMPGFLQVSLAHLLLRAARSQCRSILPTTTGAVFCTKKQSHDGDHRGYRAQWNDSGRVPITEKP